MKNKQLLGEKNFVDQKYMLKVKNNNYKFHFFEFSYLEIEKKELQISFLWIFLVRN